MEMKKRTKQKSRLTRKLCTSNEYEKIIKKNNVVVWNVFLAFSFSYRSSDCKNYCCDLKAYEITRLSKLTSFFFLNKIFNNWPYFSSLVKKNNNKKYKVTHFISVYVLNIASPPLPIFQSFPGLPGNIGPITELFTEYDALLPVIVHNIF